MSQQAPPGPLSRFIILHAEPIWMKHCPPPNTWFLCLFSLTTYLCPNTSALCSSVRSIKSLGSVYGYCFYYYFFEAQISHIKRQKTTVQTVSKMLLKRKAKKKKSMYKIRNFSLRILRATLWVRDYNFLQVLGKDIIYLYLQTQNSKKTLLAIDASGFKNIYEIDIVTWRQTLPYNVIGQAHWLTPQIILMYLQNLK